MEEFRHIPLTEIVPDPDNPRKNFVQEEFDQLVESIKAVGVIQPINVRPVNGHYMIVAGERRWKASQQAGKETIPAFIQNRAAEEAFGIQMVENLIRADITQLEEAEGFKKYLDRGEDYTVEDLAAKSGFDPRFIRRRVAIMGLPKKLLKLWEQDKISFAALEQLLRVENPEEIYNQCQWSPTASAIATAIEAQAPLLSHAKFDKTECESCPASTQVQHDMFNFASDKIRCLKRACFLEKQKAHFIEKHSEDRGVLIVERPDVNKSPLVKPRKQCAACPDFRTEIEIVTGKGRKLCMAKACPHDPKAKEAEAATKQSKRGSPDKAKEKFYKENLTSLEVPKSKQFKVAMLMMVETDARFREVAKDMLGLKAKKEDDYYWATAGEILEKLDAAEDLSPIFNAMVIKYVTRDGYQGKGDLCEWLGISIAEGFIVDEWYLKRKDKDAIVELAKEFKIFTELKQHLRRAKPEFTGDFENVPRKLIIEAFLKCDIKDKVPGELKN